MRSETYESDKRRGEKEIKRGTMASPESDRHIVNVFFLSDEFFTREKRWLNKKEETERQEVIGQENRVIYQLL